jgi:hypothetical protein
VVFSETRSRSNPPDEIFSLLVRFNHRHGVDHYDILPIPSSLSFFHSSRNHFTFTIFLYLPPKERSCLGASFTGTGPATFSPHFLVYGSLSTSTQCWYYRRHFRARLTPRCMLAILSTTLLFAP